MDADTLRKNEDQFLALTSLLPLEFDKLLAEFTPRWGHTIGIELWNDYTGQHPPTKNTDM